MTLATISITHILANGLHTTRHVRGIDATSWDMAVIEARDIVRAQHRDNGPVIAADLSTVNPDPLGPVLCKPYQPGEWA